MPRVRDRSQAALKRSVSVDIAGVAGFLQETLGQRLTAELAGVDDPKTVGHWAKGDQAPRAESEKRLRSAFQIFHFLQAEESPHTVRAWFVGLNPQLEDESPAEAIRDGRFKDVMVAARAYVAGG